MLKYFKRLLNIYYLITSKDLDKALTEAQGKVFSLFFEQATKQHKKKNKKEKQVHKVDTTEIPRRVIKMYIFRYYKNEDEEFKKSVQMDINTLIDKIIRFLDRIEMAFETKPGVNYRELVLFLAVAGRLLAKKQKEKCIILNELSIELYILSCMKDFDAKTQHFMAEFLGDLTGMLKDFIAMEIKKKTIRNKIWNYKNSIHHINRYNKKVEK